MGATSEPITCPNCSAELVTAARPHCRTFICGWVHCRCQAVVDVRNHRYYRITKEVNP